MNTLNKKIQFVEFDNEINICLKSNEIINIPYSYTSRIKNSNKKELLNYKIIGDGIGIHFPNIDEDISLDGILNYKK
jgi:hypothetical protein